MGLRAQVREQGASWRRRRPAATVRQRPTAPSCDSSVRNRPSEGIAAGPIRIVVRHIIDLSGFVGTVPEKVAGEQVRGNERVFESTHAGTRVGRPIETLVRSRTRRQQVVAQAVPGWYFFAERGAGLIFRARAHATIVQFQEAETAMQYRRDLHLETQTAETPRT